MAATPSTSSAPPTEAVVPRRGRVLAFLARVVAWPVSLALLLLGLGLRCLGLVVALLPNRRYKERLASRARRLVTYVVLGLRYLAFLSDRLPPLVGPVARDVQRRGPWDEVRRRLRRDRMAMASWVMILLYLYVAVLAATGVIAADHKADDPEAAYRSPTLSLSPPSLGDHPLGTDFLGREVWKRTVQGTMNALWIGALAAALACSIGLVLGALAGYFGRFVDESIVWFYTTLASIPYLLLMLALSFAFKSNPDIRGAYESSFLHKNVGMSLGLFTIVLAVGLTFWVGVCRVVRAEFMKLRDLDFVTAARSLGIPTRRIIFRHIAPNVFHLVLIQFSLLFMSAIKFEVILSFLGVGMEEGEASWGQMITQAKLELMRADPVWWQIAAATIAMFGLLLCVNLFTDALRDALDPRLRD